MDRDGSGADRTVRAAGVVLDLTARPDSPVLGEFFAGYDTAFVLPDEKEDLDGFRACLALGQGPAREGLLERYGPHREWVAVVREVEGGPMVGGANLIAYPVGAGVVAGNLNYAFVETEVRRRGLLRKIVAACEDVMAEAFAPPRRRALIFIELNDPFALSDEDYRLDSEIAGVDPFDRLAVWARLGARVLDFPYVQPPLSERQDAEDGLVHAMLGAGDRPSLDAGLVLAHLERFFGVSVLKGAEPWETPAAARQLEHLKEMAARGEDVRLLDPAGAVERGRTVRVSGMARPASLREYLRGL